MAKFCPNCGNQVRDTAAFCAKCGSRLTPSVPEAEAAPAPAPVPVETAPVEAAPAEPVNAPVEAVPVAAEPVAEVTAPAPAAEPVVEAVPEAAVPVAEPVIEPVPVAPVAEPAATPVAEAVAAPVVEPVAFEAPSGPLETAAPASAEEAPKKKSKVGLIILFAAIGAVALALIGVGVALVLNGGFGGTFIERIEKMDEVDSGKKYTIYNEDFNDYIEEARWWDYDGEMTKPGVYSTDVETLGFSVKVDEEAEDEIYYAYYYSKDKEFDKEDLEKPIYSDTISPVEYGDGSAYYNIDCSKKITKGYYVVVVAADESLKDPYILAYADVK